MKPLHSILIFSLVACLLLVGIVGIAQAVATTEEHTAAIGASSVRAETLVSEAIDNNSATFWTSDWDINAFPVFLILDFVGDTPRITNYTIQVRVANAGKPTPFQLLGSNDNATFTLLDSRTGLTWANSEIKTFNSFTQSVNQSTFRYYKLYIISSQADPYASIAEWHLYSETPTAPVAAFTTNHTAGTNMSSGIAPLTVQFTDTSTGTPTERNWSLQGYDGTNTSHIINWSTAQNPSATFNAGNFSISLGAGNAMGFNISVQETWVNVTQSISVDFNTTPQIASQYGMKVQFYENSTQPTQTYNWTFGDGYTSTLQNPTHIYSVAGKYLVNLSVTNSSVAYNVNKTENVNLTSDADTYLKSWHHFNGTDGGTTFNGEEGLAWTPTQVTTSTSQKKFGYSSGRFLDQKSKISTPSNTVFNFSTGNFTIEQWVYPIVTANNQYLVSRTTNAGNEGWGIYHSSSSSNSDAWRFYGGSTATQTNVFTIPLNTWSHVAVERVNGVVTVYVNGAVATSTSLSGNYDTTGSLIYGDAGVGTITSFWGYIDESRISTEARWKEAFSPPYAEYRGTLETIYPDINPSSTLRFKTDPTSTVLIANQTDGGYRNRTIQIQNVINTTYIHGVVTFDSNHLQAQEVNLNTTIWNDMTLVSYAIDNTYGDDPSTGTVAFNVTRPSGFQPGTTRSDLIDIKMLYWNYAPPNDINHTTFFGSGYLINGTTFKTYPIHNFISTPITYSDWGTFHVNFTANKTDILTGENVLFTQDTDNYPNRFDWNYGDGTTETGLSIFTANHTYTLPGLYNVTLKTYLYQNATVSNETTKTDYINVSAPIYPYYTATPQWGAAPLEVIFSETNTGALADSWYWEFGDGNTSALHEPTYIYPDPGIYGVNHSVTNDTYVLTSWNNKTAYIYVNQSLTANFAGVPTSGYIDPFTEELSVQFNDTSTGAGLSNWYWEFGDSSTSTDQNVTHNYTASGAYPVNLTIQGLDGITNLTKNNYINIYEANFTLSNTTGQAPLIVKVTDTSVGDSISAWNWSFDDGTVASGQVQPDHIYTIGGNYTVNLTVTDGIMTGIRLKYVELVNQTPVANFTASNWSGEPTLPVEFTDTSFGYGNSYYWDFDDTTTSTDQNPPEHYYTAPGTYHVNLTVTNDGGVSFIVQDIYVAVFSSTYSGTPLSGVFPLTVVFTESSSGFIPDSYFWDFGDGDATNNSVQNPVHTFTAIGIYDIGHRITNTSASLTFWNNKSAYIYSNQSLFADFVGAPLSGYRNPDPATSSLTVNFVDFSTGEGIYDWNWTFGDGGVSSLRNPPHDYADAGSYSVNLTIKGADATNITIQNNYITVYEINFTQSNITGQAPLPVLFVDSSIGNAITDWNWTFGDGTVSILQNPPVHTYLIGGNHTVNLTITDGAMTATKLSYVNLTNSTPIANFTASTLIGQPILPVTFTDTSTGYGITDYNWSFGNGNVSSLQNPPVQPFNNGTYIINLTVTNDGGSSTKLQTLYVATFAPLYTATPASGIAPLDVTFTETNTGFLVDTYYWEFGDGTAPSALQNPTHTYTPIGIYDVKHSITNATITSWLNKTAYIHANQTIIADFTGTPTTGYLSSASPPIFPAVFTNTSSGEGLYQWDWGWGDGTANGTGQNPAHNYGLPGTFNVFLKVWGADGNATVTKAGYIKINPMVANFTNTTQSITGQTITFTDISDGNPQAWLWNFGDGTTSTTHNPLYAYTIAGTYTVSLTINSTVETSTMTKPNLMHITAAPPPAPIADFIVNTLVPNYGQIVTFTDLSTQLPTSWSWNFGDGGTSVLQSPTHVYTSTGAKTVTLIATNPTGSNTTVKTGYITVQALPAPVAAFTYTPANPGIGTTVTFADTSSGSPTSWSWNFGDGGISAAQNPTHIYTAAGTYSATLTATSMWGSTSVSHNVPVTAAPPTPVPTGYVITKPATGITNNSVVMNGWTSSPSFYYYFVYGLEPGVYSYATAKTAGDSTVANFSVNIEGLPLIPSETYYYKAYIIESGTRKPANNEESATISTIGAIDAYPEFETRGTALINANFDFETLLVVIPSPFVDTMGNIFYGIIFAGAFILLWARSKSIIMPCLFGMITGGLMWNAMPSQWVQVGSALFYVSIGGFIFSIIVGRKT